MKTEIGIYEGDTCNRNGCTGEIQTAPAENCSCHSCAPCSSCTTPRNYCPACGWQEADDEKPEPSASNVKLWTPTLPRPLDPTKIDYRISGHTNASQLCEGVYPPGTTQEEVRKLVNGSWGGRFEQFGNGRFKFIAYTD